MVTLKILAKKYQRKYQINERYECDPGLIIV